MASCSENFEKHCSSDDCSSETSRSSFDNCESSDAVIMDAEFSNDDSHNESFCDIPTHQCECLHHRYIERPLLANLFFLFNEKNVEKTKKLVASCCQQETLVILPKLDAIPTNVEEACLSENFLSFKKDEHFIVRAADELQKCAFTFQNVKYLSIYTDDNLIENLQILNLFTNLEEIEFLVDGRKIKDNWIIAIRKWIPTREFIEAVEIRLVREAPDYIYSEEDKETWDPDQPKQLNNFPAMTNLKCFAIVDNFDEFEIIPFFGKTFEKCPLQQLFLVGQDINFSKRELSSIRHILKRLNLLYLDISEDYEHVYNWLFRKIDLKVLSFKRDPQHLYDEYRGGNSGYTFVLEPIELGQEKILMAFERD